MCFVNKDLCLKKLSLIKLICVKIFCDFIMFNYVNNRCVCVVFVWIWFFNVLKELNLILFFIFVIGNIVMGLL